MVLLFACRHGKCYKKSHQTRANDESTNKQPHPSRTECAKLLQFMQISLISLMNQVSSDANHDTMHDKIKGEHCHVLEICMPSNPHITKPCSTWQVLCMGIHKNNGQREPMNSKWIAVGNEWNECCWSTRSTTPATAQRQGPPGHPALTEALLSRLRSLRGVPSSCIRRFHRLHRLHLTFQKDFLQGPHGRASKTWMVNFLVLINVLNQNL